MGANDDLTSVILKKLAMYFPLFYGLHFGVCYVLCLIFDIDFDAKIPFDFDDFDPSGNKRELVGFLNLVIVFLLSAILHFFIVRSTKKAFDYAFTMAFVHWIASMAVMGEFPTNWIWWVAIPVLTFLLSTLGELSCYYLRDMREVPTGN